MAPSKKRYSAVEQLDEAAQEVGWKIKHRQIKGGSFAAELASLECDGVHLASERFNNHLQIVSEPPVGFVGIFLPRFPRGGLTICGSPLAGGDLIGLSAGAELEAVTRGEILNETVFMAEGTFRSSAHALVGESELLSPRTASIHHADRVLVGALQRQISSILKDGALDPETVSCIVASLLQLLADGSKKVCCERLANGGAASVAGRARHYIEEHFRDTVRMTDLCRHTGAKHRTLLRCFRTRFQVSPEAYIKARRLDAARRELVDGNPRETSVTDIAMRSGFTHLGRFAVTYRQHFGQSPSETLGS